MYTKSQQFLGFMIFFLGGVLFSSAVLDIKELYFSIFLVFSALGFIVLSFYFSEKSFFVFAVAFYLGLFWFLNSYPTVDESYISFYNGQKVSIKGYICEEVDVRKDKIKVTLCSEEIFVDNVWKAVNGKILINLPRYPQYSYGDLLEIKGDLVEPMKIEDFDYDKYLARYDIHSVMYEPFVKFTKNNKGNFFLKKLFQLKEFVESKINYIFAEPYASFESGLILGSRKGIPDDLNEKFKITGLSHIVAISGYNITLIIVFISGFLSFLDRRKQVLVSIGFVIVFVIFVGASSAVVRAGIMGILGLLAIWFSRKSFIPITITFTAFLMTVYNPKILTYDIGFQLSFLATLGLIYISPIIGKYLNFPDYYGARESLLLTLSAEITTLPIMLMNFGRFSLISPLANILVAPLVPIAMLFGFIAFLASLISLTLAKILALPAVVSLKIMIFLIDICSRIPFADLKIDFFNTYFVLIYFVLLVIFLKKKIKEN